MGFLSVSSLCIFFLIGNISCSFPPKNFRFNCIYDICTFPIQYCDLNDKRCRYCNDDVCRRETVPEQCIYRCSGLDTTKQIEITTAVPVYKEAKSITASNNKDQEHIHSNTLIYVLIAALIVVSTLLFVVIFLLFFVWRKLRKANEYNATRHKEVFVAVPCDGGSKQPLLENPNQENDDSSLNDSENGRSLTLSTLSEDRQIPQPTATPGGQIIEFKNETLNGIVTQPEPSQSQAKHFNPNERQLLNFDQPSTTSDNLSPNNVQPEPTPQDKPGRHQNINDNEILNFKDYASSQRSTTSPISTTPTARVSPERNDSIQQTDSHIPTPSDAGQASFISTPTDEGVPNQHEKPGDINLLKSLAHSPDSGFEEDTALKYGLNTAITSI